MRNEVWIDNIFANYSYQKFLTNDTLKFAFLLCLVTEFGYFCSCLLTRRYPPRFKQFILYTMEITGRIIAVMEKRSGQSQRSGNTWASQDYVLETQEQYPRRCLFNVFGEDKINEYNLQIGSEVTVSFDINAREYNGRWYNDIRAWRVVPAQTAAPVAPAAAPAAPEAVIPAPVAAPAAPEDDLPF